ncbi:MAG: hypothetical protein K9N52_03140 [Verrucomicrobia bacterium]|nr:hypothetical protein [Verrucomicrobiota bacterium]
MWKARNNEFSHYAIALIIALFAASHIADLIIGDSSHNQYNPVFIYIINKYVFILASVLEILVALICIWCAGKIVADYALLILVTLYVWYRVSFYLTGGHDCGCTGVLGKLFGIPKTIEILIPVIVLVLMLNVGLYGILVKRNLNAHSKI